MIQFKIVCSDVLQSSSEVKGTLLFWDCLHIVAIITVD